MDGDADRSHDWLTGNRNHGLPESSRSRRRRRPPGNVHAFTPAASRPPAMDDDADFYAAAGHPPIERLEQGTNSFDLLPPRRPPPPSLPLRVPDYLRDRFPGRQITSPHYLALDYELSRRRPSATRSQASSSTATPSDHPGAERTGSRTRIRQSALYADRPRHSRHRRSARNLEHSSDVSSSELEVTNPPTFEALSVRDSTTFPSGTEEHPREVSSSELGGAVTDLPTLEPLSLMSELPLLSPDETSEQSDDEDVDEEHTSHVCTDVPTVETISESDSRAPLEVSDGDCDGLPDDGACGQAFLFFNQPKGISTSMVLDAGPLVITVSDDEEEQPKPDSDVDSDEFQREMEEYFAAHPCVPLRQAFDRIFAIEQATLTAQAAELGTEPPSAVIAQAAAEVERQQETRPQQSPQQASAAAIQRHGSSIEDIVRNEKTWMCEEVMVCFNKYLERSADLAGLEYKLDELCHQCFNVENYNKVFHHYNFRVMMKMPSSVDWILELYFAEVKQMFGRKYYFCCPLEPDEDGDCFACKNQGVEDLKHPATGGFDVGSPDAQYSLW